MPKRHTGPSGRRSTHTKLLCEAPLDGSRNAERVEHSCSDLRSTSGGVEKGPFWTQNVSNSPVLYLYAGNIAEYWQGHMIGHGDPVSGRLAFEWVKNTAFKGPGDVPSVS